eukprot:1157376-Pelagomonas_calceolata.AAC.4
MMNTQPFKWRLRGLSGAPAVPSCNAPVLCLQAMHASDTKQCSGFRHHAVLWLQIPCIALGSDTMQCSGIGHHAVLWVRTPCSVLDSDTMQCSGFALHVIVESAG